jgi:hypothetical protein
MMSSGAEEFFYLFDKDEALKRAFLADPAAALAHFTSVEEELHAIARRDVVAMRRLGLHPILLRNFCAALRIDYVTALKG